jgi:P27 family predicted phage terminase small subunit
MATRRTKAQKAADEAARLAGLLAAAPAEADDALAPPAYIADPRLAPALATWRELAPRLSALMLVEHIDRTMFALFCYYHAEFIAAVDDLLRTGYAVAVKTVSGDRMLRRNPSVDRRDKAADMLMDLAKRFGLTKLDRFALFKAERDGQAPEPPAAPREPASPDGTAGTEDDGGWAGVLGGKHRALH